VGERGIDPALDIGQVKVEDSVVVPAQPVEVPGAKYAETMNRLNYDDLLVMKSSMECKYWCSLHSNHTTVVTIVIIGHVMVILTHFKPVINVSCGLSSTLEFT